jgi:hypothetical protein
MRHFIPATAIAAHSFGMRKAAMATALIALAGHAHADLTRDLSAVAVAVDLAAIATAANDDLRPAAGAHKEAACGRHRQSPSMPKRYRRDWWTVPYWLGTRAPCACGARHRNELGGLSRCRACFFGGRRNLLLPHQDACVTPPELRRAGCVCTRPSGSFRRTRDRTSFPGPAMTKQL